MKLLSFSLNQMERLTVQAKMTPSCYLMEDSLVKVALVRSLKKGNRILAVVGCPLLVLVVVVLVELDSLGATANSLRFLKTRFLHILRRTWQ